MLCRPSAARQLAGLHDDDDWFLLLKVPLPPRFAAFLNLTLGRLLYELLSAAEGMNVIFHES